MNEVSDAFIVTDGAQLSNVSKAANEGVDSTEDRTGDCNPPCEEPCILAKPVLLGN